MPGLNTITPKQLMRLIGTPDCPVLIDVRTDEDWQADPRYLPTARRLAHTQPAALSQAAREGPVVVICHKGLKLSQGTAALLRASGHRAEALDGGFVAWAADGLPLVPDTAIPPRHEGRTRWVTRHRPKIDRIACPWLIRRFVDPSAEVLFVAPSEVLAVAERFNAVPFDIEGVNLSHHGALCSFDAMLLHFGLVDPALDRLAQVIRAADTNRHADVPQAAGLLALSVGLSRMYRDDMAQLDAAMPLYDALYRWARDGFEEGHDWPTGQGT